MPKDLSEEDDATELEVWLLRPLLVTALVPTGDVIGSEVTTVWGTKIGVITDFKHWLGRSGNVVRKIYVKGTNGARYAGSYGPANTQQVWLHLRKGVE